MSRLRAKTLKIKIATGLALLFCLLVSCLYADETVILPGNTLQGFLWPNETATYQFSAQSNDSVTIRALPTNAFPNGLDLPPRIKLYGPDGVLLANALGQIDKILPSSGTYKVTVTNIGTFGEFYYLTLLILNSPSNLVLNFEQKVNGTVVSHGFTIYSFVASANDAVGIITTSSSAYLELYNSEGITVAKGTKRIDAVMRTSGRYALVIGAGPDVILGSLDYTLSLKKYSKTLLKYAEAASGEITVEEPSRFYVFLAYPNDSVTISISKISEYLLPYVQLYGPAGEFLEANASKIERTLTVGGTYLLRVTSDKGSTFGTYSLLLTKKNHPPSPVSITPASGVTLPEQAISLSTVFTDADPVGWHDIQVAYLLINKTTAGSSCFFGYYAPQTNKLYLRNDADTAWLGGFFPGSNYVIKNSFASLDCGKTTVSRSGSTLTINWSIAFTSSFIPQTYNAYLFAKDEMQAESGWVQRGTLRVDTLEIALFQPQDKSRFIEGNAIQCSAQALPASAQNQYQFLVDAKLRRAFGAGNSWQWQTAAQDIGTHTLTIQVKNQYGTQVEKSQRLIIYRRPIEPQ